MQIIFSIPLTYSYPPILRFKQLNLPLQKCFTCRALENSTIQISHPIPSIVRQIQRAINAAVSTLKRLIGKTIYFGKGIFALAFPSHEFAAAKRFRYHWQNYVYFSMCTSFFVCSRCCYFFISMKHTRIKRWVMLLCYKCCYVVLFREDESS